MIKSLLIRVLGSSALFIHGDTLMLDRWLWLKSRIPATRNDEKLIDIGCGSGAFSIGTAKLGYNSLGLSWDDRNNNVAIQRARICGATTASFSVVDVRKLDHHKNLVSAFDIAICLENIEHIIDDRKLMQDIAACLKPGGRLLLTTPSLFYRPITSEDMGPFSKVEDGNHVRRGYTKAMLEELCQQSGLVPTEFSDISGFTSQRLTAVLRSFSRIHPLLGWILILPFRWIPPLTDHAIANVLSYPYFCIGLEAYKPRFIEGSIASL